MYDNHLDDTEKEILIKVVAYTQIPVLWMDDLESQRHNHSYRMVSNTKIWVEISIVLTLLCASLTSPLFWIKKFLFPLNNIPGGCITCSVPSLLLFLFSQRIQGKLFDIKKREVFVDGDAYASLLLFSVIMDLASIDNGAHAVHVPNEHYTFVNNFLLRARCQKHRRWLAHQVFSYPRSHRPCCDSS